MHRSFFSDRCICIDCIGLDPALRLRIGHTYFSHSFILRKEDPPECTACLEIYSVRRVVIDCIALGLIRPRFYTVPDMKTLFDTVSVNSILSFVKEVNLFDKV